MFNFSSFSFHLYKTSSDRFGPRALCVSFVPVAATIEHNNNVFQQKKSVGLLWAV